MKNLLLLTLLLLVTLMYPATTQAAEVWSCISGSETFCDQDHGPAAFVKKSGCFIHKDFKKQCDNIEQGGQQNGTGDTCFTLHTEACVCEFKQISNTCTTTGGIKDAGTDVDSVFGRINTPSWIAALGIGERGISNLLQKMIQLIYIVAGVGFVIMFLWAGVQLILSGGDKEGVAKSKGRITYALIGLVVMAFAFVIFRFLEGFLGFKFLG